MINSVGKKFWWAVLVEIINVNNSYSQNPKGSQENWKIINY